MNNDRDTSGLDGVGPGQVSSPGSCSTLSIEITDPTARLTPADLRWLGERCTSAVAAVPGAGALGFEIASGTTPSLVGEIRVRVVGDHEMSAAHLEFCEVEGTTDVLTFDMSEQIEPSSCEPASAWPGGDAAVDLVSNPFRSIPVLDVDILACIDEAGRQAKARGHTVAQELLLYILHGTLHCLGHDDHDEAASGAMHAAEDRVLAAIGVGPTFAVGGDPTAAPRLKLSAPMSQAGEHS